MKVFSPMPAGSGAWVVHNILASAIPGYTLQPYDPRLTLLPPLLRFVPRRAADIIHSTPDHAAFFAQEETPLVVTFHNYVLDSEGAAQGGAVRRLHNRLVLRRLTRSALVRAHAVTAVSRYTADLLRRDLGFEGPVRVIYNGIDLERFRPAPPRPDKGTTVLYCGNLIPRKGVDLIPQILDRLAPGIGFDYASGLRSTRARIRHERARSLGTVPYGAMPDVYRSADILLFPTLREGFGLAAAEAMACGLPVVASDCSSLPELVEHGRGGFLCPPRDAAAFAEAINRLAADPDLRREMGAFNRARAETLFDQRHMVQEYRELFGEVARA